MQEESSHVRTARIFIFFILDNNGVSIQSAFLCLCQDETRVHKVTKRLHTLEEVNINVKLLTEMLSHYDRDSSTDSDKEIIKVI